MEIIDKKILKDKIFINAKFDGIKFVIEIDFIELCYNVKSKGLFDYFTVLDSFKSKYIEGIISGKTTAIFSECEDQLYGHIEALLRLMNGKQTTKKSV